MTLPPPHPHFHRDILPRRPSPGEGPSPCPVKGPGQALGQQQELHAGETEWGPVQDGGEAFGCKRTASPVEGVHRLPRSPAWDPASAKNLSGSPTKAAGGRGAPPWSRHGVIPTASSLVSQDACTPRATGAAGRRGSETGSRLPAPAREVGQVHTRPQPPLRCTQWLSLGHRRGSLRSLGPHRGDRSGAQDQTHPCKCH